MWHYRILAHRCGETYLTCGILGLLACAQMSHTHGSWNGNSQGPGRYQTILSSGNPFCPLYPPLLSGIFGPHSYPLRGRPCRLEPLVFGAGPSRSPYAPWECSRHPVTGRSRGTWGIICRWRPSVSLLGDADQWWGQSPSWAGWN